MLQNIESQASKRREFNTQYDEHKTERTPEYEITQFMKNFEQALLDGNVEEIETYYADGAQASILSELIPVFLNQKVSADEKFAVFSALVCQSGKNSRDYSDNRSWCTLICILEKTHGFWELVHVKAG